MKTYDMLNGAWKETGRTTIYYSGGTPTNISETDNAVLSAYPNPFTESVSFKWKSDIGELTLEIYQISGAKVLEQKTLSGNPVSLSKLESGVYLYKLVDGKQTLNTGKLIKNKMIQTVLQTQKTRIKKILKKL